MRDRKYRQRGYMDKDREPQRPRSQSPQSPQSNPRENPRDREGPRSPKMMGFGETVNGSSCGAKAPPQSKPDNAWTNRGAHLHTCRQCAYFDPGARFQCSKTITVRIVNKNANNTCELFAPRTVVERQTSSGGAPTDARQAFANLFKKS